VLCYYLKSFFINSKEFSESFFLVHLFVVVQFSMSYRCRRFVDSLYIISHTLPLVKRFFKTFFKFFEVFLYRSTALRDSLVIIPLLPSLCQALFRLFSSFYIISKKETEL